MKYLSQICIILGYTLAGEALHRLLPLPIPAAVYGLALLLLSLCLGLVKVGQVKETGTFLTAIMPILFVAPTVGIVEHWELIRPRLLPMAGLVLASTVLVFGISGKIAQLAVKKEEKADE